jgi:hypothetical protein
MTESPENQPQGDDSEQQGDNEFDPKEIENDPAYNPDDEQLEQVRGG